MASTYRHITMFDNHVAEKIGMIPAIIVNKVAHMIEVGLGKTAEDDGRTYVYISRSEWCKKLNYLGEKTVQRQLANAEKSGVLLSRDNLNKLPYDRTKWYTVDEELLETMTLDPRIQKLKELRRKAGEASKEAAQNDEDGGRHNDEGLGHNDPRGGLGHNDPRGWVTMTQGLGHNDPDNTLDTPLDTPLDTLHTHTRVRVRACEGVYRMPEERFYGGWPEEFGATPEELGIEVQEPEMDGIPLTLVEEVAAAIASVVKDNYHPMSVVGAHAKKAEEFRQTAVFATKLLMEKTGEPLEAMNGEYVRLVWADYWEQHGYQGYAALTTFANQFENAVDGLLEIIAEAQKKQ